MKTLGDVKVGESSTIVKLHGEGALRRHLMDLGLIKGTSFKVVKVAPLGDPVEINVRGYELSIRKEEAAVTDWTEDTNAICANRQSEILTSAAKMLRPGGRLVYSTCTVLERENLAVVRSFLKENREFCLKPFVSRAAGPTPGYITLLPNLHNTDGFFVAKLERMDYDGKNRNQDPDNG